MGAPMMVFQVGKTEYRGDTALEIVRALESAPARPRTKATQKLIYRVAYDSSHHP